MGLKFLVAALCRARASPFYCCFLACLCWAPEGTFGKPPSPKALYCKEPSSTPETAGLDLQRQYQQLVFLLSTLEEQGFKEFLCCSVVKCRVGCGYLNSREFRFREALHSALIQLHKKELLNCSSYSSRGVCSVKQHLRVVVLFLLDTPQRSVPREKCCQHPYIEISSH